MSTLKTKNARETRYLSQVLGVLVGDSPGHHAAVPVGADPAVGPRRVQELVQASKPELPERNRFADEIAIVA